MSRTYLSMIPYRPEMINIIREVHESGITYFDTAEAYDLMFAGAEADTRYMTEDAFEKATGTDRKSLSLIENASHIETYWKPHYVDQAIETLVDFYADTLGKD